MDSTATFISLGHGLIYAVIGTFFIWLVKKVDDWRTKEFDDDVHIDDGNLAVGMRRSGLYLGMAIALSGAVGGYTGSLFIDLLQMVLDGLIITGFLFSSRFLNDLVMMGHLNNDAECVREFELPGGGKQTGNTALGIVEAGMYIATGFILNGSISGGGGTFVQGILSAVLFFILGQITLLVFGLLYEIVTPFNIRDEIKKNNPAAGIALSGVLIALGIVLMSSISGPFTGWKNDIAGFCIYAIFGIVLLLVLRLVVDRLLLPTTNIATEVKEDRNTAALMVVESVMVAVAVIIAFSL